jgi:hypothetical protein
MLYIIVVTITIIIKGLNMDLEELELLISEILSKENTMVNTKVNLIMDSIELYVNELEDIRI